MKIINSYLLIIMVMFIGMGCKKNSTLSNESMLPKLITKKANITSTSSIQLSAMISSNGYCVITEVGFCYDVKHQPTIDANKLTSKTREITFTENLEGLTNKDIYYVRSYAITNMGLVYGNEVEADLHVYNYPKMVIHQDSTQSDTTKYYYDSLFRLQRITNGSGQNLTTYIYDNASPYPSVINYKASGTNASYSYDSSWKIMNYSWTNFNFSVIIDSYKKCFVFHLSGENPNDIDSYIDSISEGNVNLYLRHSTLTTNYTSPPYSTNDESFDTIRYNYTAYDNPFYGLKSLLIDYNFLSWMISKNLPLILTRHGVAYNNGSLKYSRSSSTSFYYTFYQDGRLYQQTLKGSTGADVTNSYFY